MSDDDRAREVYAKKEDAAHLPSTSLPPDGTDKATASAEGSTTGTEKAGSTGGTDGKKDPAPGSGTEPTSSATPGADDGTSDDGSGGSPAENLQPRVLDTLGDSAFLDDALTRAGSTAQHRTVSVVFRTSNVIVTIEYTAQPALSTEVPDSKELQEKAQALGEKLVDTFSE